jgi:peptide/nickel transport system permease protein
MLLALFVIGLSSSFITSRDPLKTGYASGLTPSSPEFVMGTDQLGRDVFSWVIHGIRVAFYVGGASTLISFAIALLGIFAGYYGGLVDQVLMRATDLVMSVPRFVLVVVLATLFGTSFVNLVFIIGGLSWPTLARIMRAETLSLREREFVLSARVAGCSSVDIMFSEILPNILPVVLPNLALQFSRSIIDEIGISFLGLGDPNLPSWGKLIAIGRQAIFAGGWWVLVYPCVVCVIVLLAVNLFADRLNDALNPKMQSVGQ